MDTTDSANSIEESETVGILVSYGQSDNHKYAFRRPNNGEEEDDDDSSSSTGEDGDETPERLDNNGAPHKLPNGKMHKKSSKSSWELPGSYYKNDHHGWNMNRQQGWNMNHQQGWNQSDCGAWNAKGWNNPSGGNDWIGWDNSDWASSGANGKSPKNRKSSDWTTNPSAGDDWRGWHSTNEKHKAGWNGQKNVWPTNGKSGVSLAHDKSDNNWYSPGQTAPSAVTGVWVADPSSGSWGPTQWTEAEKKQFKKWKKEMKWREKLRLREADPSYNSTNTQGFVKTTDEESRKALVTILAGAVASSPKSDLKSDSFLTKGVPTMKGLPPGIALKGVMPAMGMMSKSAGKEKMAKGMGKEEQVHPAYQMYSAYGGWSGNVDWPGMHGSAGWPAMAGNLGYPAPGGIAIGKGKKGNIITPHPGISAATTPARNTPTKGCTPTGGKTPAKGATPAGQTPTKGKTPTGGKTPISAEGETDSLTTSHKGRGVDSLASSRKGGVDSLTTSAKDPNAGKSLTSLKGIASTLKGIASTTAAATPIGTSSEKTNVNKTHTDEKKPEIAMKGISSLLKGKNAMMGKGGNPVMEKGLPSGIIGGNGPRPAWIIWGKDGKKNGKPGMPPFPTGMKGGFRAAMAGMLKGNLKGNPAMAMMMMKGMKKGMPPIAMMGKSGFPAGMAEKGGFASAMMMAKGMMGKGGMVQPGVTPFLKALGKGLLPSAADAVDLNGGFPFGVPRFLPCTSRWGKGMQGATVALVQRRKEREKNAAVGRHDTKPLNASATAFKPRTTTKPDPEIDDKHSTEADDSENDDKKPKLKIEKKNSDNTNLLKNLDFLNHSKVKPVSRSKPKNFSSSGSAASGSSSASGSSENCSHRDSSSNSTSASVGMTSFPVSKWEKSQWKADSQWHSGWYYGDAASSTLVSHAMCQSPAMWGMDPKAWGMDPKSWTTGGNWSTDGSTDGWIQNKKGVKDTTWKNNQSDATTRETADSLKSEKDEKDVTNDVSLIFSPNMTTMTTLKDIGYSSLNLNPHTKEFVPNSSAHDADPISPLSKWQNDVAMWQSNEGGEWNAYDENDIAKWSVHDDGTRWEKHERDPTQWLNEESLEWQGAAEAGEWPNNESVEWAAAAEAGEWPEARISKEAMAAIAAQIGVEEADWDSIAPNLHDQLGWDYTRWGEEWNSSKEWSSSKIGSGEGEGSKYGPNIDGSPECKDALGSPLDNDDIVESSPKQSVEEWWKQMYEGCTKNNEVGGVEWETNGEWNASVDGTEWKPEDSMADFQNKIEDMDNQNNTEERTAKSPHDSNGKNDNHWFPSAEMWNPFVSWWYGKEANDRKEREEKKDLLVPDGTKDQDASVECGANKDVISAGKAKDGKKKDTQGDGKWKDRKNDGKHKEKGDEKKATSKGKSSAGKNKKGKTGKSKDEQTEDSNKESPPSHRARTYKSASSHVQASFSAFNKIKSSPIEKLYPGSADDAVSPTASNLESILSGESDGIYKNRRERRRAKREAEVLDDHAAILMSNASAEGIPISKDDAVEIAVKHRQKSFQ